VIKSFTLAGFLTVFFIPCTTCTLSFRLLCTSTISKEVFVLLLMVTVFHVLVWHQFAPLCGQDKTTQCFLHSPDGLGFHTLVFIACSSRWMSCIHVRQ